MSNKSEMLNLGRGKGPVRWSLARGGTGDGELKLAVVIELARPMGGTNGLATPGSDGGDMVSEETGWRARFL